MSLTFRGFKGALLVMLATLIFGGCAHIPDRVQGVPTTSPSAEVPWPPPSAAAQIPVQTTAPPIPIEQVRQEHARLSLVDVVDIALRDNPATHTAWEDARAAAARYASTRGSWFPTVTLNSSLYHSKNTAPQGSTAGQPQEPITETITTANLTYLLLDFGGRPAAVEESRQALLAANWNQNAVIQNIILQVEIAFFNNAGAKALLGANRTSLADAEANLAAAEERRRMGMATGADVLQTKTAYSETLLAVQDAEGRVRKTKAALAVAMGYPANTTFDLETEIPAVPDVTLTQTVDELINRALTDRPDLQASRSVTLQARARVKETRSRMLPTLSASGSVSRIWSGIAQGPQRSPYSLSLLLQIPVFDGFSRQFDLMQAKTAADAALERTRSAEQIATYQVFSAHSDFLTAGERVKTTNDLMDSARQSEEVALGRYKEGVGSILDLLSAQKSLASARAEQINSHLSWFIALAQLAHDVGILDPRGDNPLVPGTWRHSSEVKHHDNNQESK